MADVRGPKFFREYVLVESGLSAPVGKIRETVSEDFASAIYISNSLLTCFVASGLVVSSQASSV